LVIWLAALAAEVAGDLTDVDLQAIARVVDAVGDGNEDPADSGSCGCAGFPTQWVGGNGADHYR
jgi:hypothetical protein